MSDDDDSDDTVIPFPRDEGSGYFTNCSEEDLEMAVLEADDRLGRILELLEDEWGEPMDFAYEAYEEVEALRMFLQRYIHQ